MFIGIVGIAGSGKTTVATHLEKLYGFKRHSFAAPLKMMAQEVFDFSDDQVWGTQAQKETVDSRYGMSPREALQRLGTAARNHLGKNIWCQSVLSSVCATRKHQIGSRHCIEDVRYSNEATQIKAIGGILVRLVNLDLDAQRMGDLSNHPSETEQTSIQCDWELVAPKSPGAGLLLAEVDTLMRTLL